MSALTVPHSTLRTKTVVLISVAMMLSGSAIGGSDPRAVFERASSSVYELHLQDENGVAEAVASALSLGGGRFVTRCETGWNPQQHTLQLRKDSTVFVARLESRDAQNALCALVADGARKLPAPRLAGLPSAGDTVYAVSNGLGLGTGISEGVVSAIRGANNERRIQFTAAISPGSEGGGLFDANGALIGMIETSRREGQNINFAIEARQLAGVAQRAAVIDAAAQEQSRFAAEAERLVAEQKWAELLQHADRWSKRHRTSVDAQIAKAQANEGLNRTPAAEAAYRAALALDASHRQAAFGLCRTLIGQQKTDDALTAARRLTADFGDELDAWLMLAYTQAMAKRLDEAEASYRHAQQLYPWSSGPLDGLAHIAALRGDTAASLDYRRRAHHLARNDTGAVMRLADAYLAARKPERALELILGQGASADTDGDLLYFRGRALAALGRPQESSRVLRLSLEHKPRSPAWVWSAIGENAYAQQRWAEAIASFRTAIALSPDEPLWRWRLGLALKDSARFDEAMDIFKRWAKDFPKDPDGWRQIGFIHASTNRNADAVKSLEHAISIDPSQIQVWQALVEVYYKLDRHEDARRAYGRLRELDRERAELAYLCCIVPLEITR